jgi:hypothetical protein
MHDQGAFGLLCCFWTDDSGFLSLPHWMCSQVFDVHGHEKSANPRGVAPLTGGEALDPVSGCFP